MSQEQETILLHHIAPEAKAGRVTTRTNVKQAFEQQVGHKVHKTTIYRLLQRHQWGKRKPRPIHPKADPDEQEAFKATFAQQVQQVLAQRDSHDPRPVVLMASDEGRFGRTGELGSCWCPPGVRPTIARQAGQTIRLCLCCRCASFRGDELPGVALSQYSDDESVFATDCN